MQTSSALALKDLEYNRDALRAKYGTQRDECKRITIVENPSGMTHEFDKPLFGRLILEHDGVRTVVQRLGVLGNKEVSFTTYEAVSMQIEYA
jgi:hypothetical protein